MFTLLLYLLALGWLGYSWFKDKNKTKQAVMKGLRSFLNIFPSFAAVLLFIGLMFTFISPEFVSRLIGSSSGFLGMLVTSVVGAITLIRLRFSSGSILGVSRGTPQPTRPTPQNQCWLQSSCLAQRT